VTFSAVSRVIFWLDADTIYDNQQNLSCYTMYSFDHCLPAGGSGQDKFRPPTVMVIYIKA